MFEAEPSQHPEGSKLAKPTDSPESNMPACRRSTTRISIGRLSAAVGALTTLLIAWMWPLGGMARDLFAAHMLQHLVVMNVAALLIAVVWQSMRRERNSPPQRGRGELPLVTTAQLAALWIWHMPAIFASAHHSPILNGFMQMSLFAAALLFWRAILRSRGRSAWPSIFALLATAKVFCLLGAILVFSRRALYPVFGDPQAWELSALEDQQLAGLLMVSSCAVTYVAAAIALFARWLATTESDSRGQPQLARGSGGAIIAE
jgi:putative membrane protein